MFGRDFLQVRHEGDFELFFFLQIVLRSVIHVDIVYVIESATLRVLFTSCLCQKPERARYERVRAFDTNNE